MLKERIIIPSFKVIWIIYKQGKQTSSIRNQNKNAHHYSTNLTSGGRTEPCAPQSANKNYFIKHSHTIC